MQEWKTSAKPLSQRMWCHTSIETMVIMLKSSAAGRTSCARLGFVRSTLFDIQVIAIPLGKAANKMASIQSLRMSVALCVCVSACACGRVHRRESHDSASFVFFLCRPSCGRPSYWAPFGWEIYLAYANARVANAIAKITNWSGVRFLYFFHCSCCPAWRFFFVPGLFGLVGSHFLFGPMPCVLSSLHISLSLTLFLFFLLSSLLSPSHSMQQSSWIISMATTINRIDSIVAHVRIKTKSSNRLGYIRQTIFSFHFVCIPWHCSAKRFALIILYKQRHDKGEQNRIKSARRP